MGHYIEYGNSGIVQYGIANFSANDFLELPFGSILLTVVMLGCCQGPQLVRKPTLSAVVPLHIYIYTYNYIDIDIMSTYSYIYICTYMYVYV